MGGDDEGEKRATHGLVALQSLKKQVGVDGLEPSTSASQTQRASRLRYTPAKVKYILKSRFASSSVGNCQLAMFSWQSVGKVSVT